MTIIIKNNKAITMWETIKKRLKSKTYQLSLLMGFMGIVEMNFHLLQEILGQYYGVTYIAAMFLFMLVREMTNSAISEK